MRRIAILGTLLAAATGLPGATHRPGGPATFRVRVENVSLRGTLTPSIGPGMAATLSSGVWVLHDAFGPLFTTGRPDRGEGLEELAEDGNPGRLAAYLPSREGVVASGLFGNAGDRPLGPGDAIEFEISALRGERLSLAMMLRESNDLFFAPIETGIALFDARGRPVSGDVTDQILLWDAGTEIHQEPGLGAFQGSRQTRPGAGFAEQGTVHPVEDGFVYPDVSRVLRVTIATTR
ncbi:MAG: spondin domain-containing protein [Acidobacteria bacterium]|nr:spondin domain-containing protein [Acidobacteriota bacterium]